MPYHSYIFFDVEQSIHRLARAKLVKAKKEFAKIIEKRKSVRMQAYSTLGFKAGTRFALNLNAASPDEIQALLRDLLPGLAHHSPKSILGRLLAHFRDRFPREPRSHRRECTSQESNRRMKRRYHRHRR